MSRPILRSRSALACTLTVCFAALLPARAADLAATRRVDTVDHDRGLVLPDPYRWMEGESNPGLTAWLSDQGAQTRVKLDAAPSLARWRARLGEVAKASRSHSGHVMAGGRLFFRRTEAGKEAKLMVREPSGEERTVFDPNLATGAAHISNVSPSPDGRFVTINVSRGGNEIGQVELYDVAAGKALADVLQPVWSEFNPSWLPDGSGFAYTRMRGTDGVDPMQGMSSHIHRIGQPMASDVPIAAADGSGALAIDAASFPVPEFVPGSAWAMMSIVGARPTGRLCVARRDALLSGAPAWRCLADFDDDIASATILGDTAYLLQTGRTPYGRVLAIDLSNPRATLATAAVAVAERDGMVISEIAAARDGLYVKTMRDGVDHLERLAAVGAPLRPIVLPVTGSIAYLRTAADAPGAIVSAEGWTVPRTVYQLDGSDAPAVDLRLGRDAPADYSALVAERVEAVSADGTRVPLSVLHRPDMTTDGSALAIVEGYGGYGVSTQPNYFPMLLEWVEAGHVYAYCHVRGGGEKGDAWRVAGAGINKQRGVEDFIACAKTLAAKGYTSAARTAGMAASMGGVLAGGAYVTEPGAFGAMVVNAGVFNPVRLLSEQNGANQIPEMGDPRTAAGLRQLLAMDPYQKIQASPAGTRYPFLLLNVGTADKRVPPSSSAKFAAAVGHAAPATPVWIRTEDGLGHFPTSYSAFALVFSDLFAALEAQLPAK